ncbi:Zn-ribbon domain-containing OB-fold protein [Ornithinimicrobium faecis]|uniref:Zn-ribbon domain-containing OB-fold protein n=1 Tax=Ornithinimicrobium faecis TaxID=2934158 RepID=UPI003CE59D8C
MVIRFQECTACSHRIYPVRAHCTRCGAHDLAIRESRGLGVVHSATVVRTHPEREFRAETPYVVALVDLDDGVRILCRVRGVEPGAQVIGARVQESSPADENSPFIFSPVHH